MTAGTRIRVVSSLIATGVVLALVYFYGTPGVAILTGLLSLLALIEFSNMTLSQPGYRVARIPFFIMGACVFAVNALRHDLILPSIILATIVMMASFLALARNEEIALSELVNKTGVSIWGIIYAGVCPLYIYLLTQLSPNMRWFFFTAVVVFCGDIAAYFIGRHYGKTKLFPRVSPNKSVEGAIGSLFASVIAGLIFRGFFLPNSQIFLVFTLCIFGSIAAQTGDLSESLLKRACNTKDSGSIMPGHGGILDRLDGVLFAAPVIFTFVYLVNP